MGRLVATLLMLVSGSVTAAERGMTLTDYLALVHQRNDKIAYQRLEWRVAGENVKSASAIYEPVLNASYQYTDSDTPNTVEEAYRRNFLNEFLERNNDYVVGVEGLAPSGAKVKLSYTLRDLTNNIQPDPLQGKEFKSFLGGSVVQPLLKGFGRDVTEAGIHLAESEEKIQYQTYRQALMETLANAATAYWDLYLAQQRLELRRQSVGIAEQVLNDDRTRARLGRVAETAVLASEAGVAQRRALLIEARQALVASRNEVRRFIAGLPGEEETTVLAEARPITVVDRPVYDELLANAYRLRPEYLAARLRIEKEQVGVVFAENSTLPQLDLTASYGINGLDQNFGKSWASLADRQYPTWYVGVEYSMPLTGGKKANSELAAAKMRKGQALLELKNAEISIQNNLDTAIRNLEAALDQSRLLGRVVANNRNLLDVEMTRFGSGQSNSRQVLEREENLNRALESELEVQVNLQKAMVGLRLAEGTLLREYGIEE